MNLGEDRSDLSVGGAPVRVQHKLACPFPKPGESQNWRFDETVAKVCEGILGGRGQCERGVFGEVREQVLLEIIRQGSCNFGIIFYEGPIISDLS